MLCGMDAIANLFSNWGGWAAPAVGIAIFLALWGIARWSMKLENNIENLKERQAALEKENILLRDLFRQVGIINFVLKNRGLMNTQSTRADTPQKRGRDHHDE